MFDGQTGGTRLERARGSARVELRDGRLVDLRQAGSAKAMLPRTHGAAPEIVFLNTAGGVTGGDRFDLHLSVEGGAATGTTQTAERAYRSADGPAKLAVTLSVKDAVLAWLPQETILYDGAALARDTCVLSSTGLRNCCLWISTSSVALLWGKPFRICGLETGVQCRSRAVRWFWIPCG